MKNIILKTATVATLFACGAANASQPVCLGAASATNAAVASSTSFIKQAFTAKCSANVWLSYEHNDTDLGVCSASRKGNFKFTGTTAGGAVSATGTKATTGFDAQVTADSAGCS